MFFCLFFNVRFNYPFHLINHHPGSQSFQSLGELRATTLNTIKPKWSGVGKKLPYLSTKFNTLRCDERVWFVHMNRHDVTCLPKINSLLNNNTPASIHRHGILYQTRSLSTFFREMFIYDSRDWAKVRAWIIEIGRKRSLSCPADVLQFHYWADGS